MQSTLHPRLDRGGQIAGQLIQVSPKAPSSSAVRTKEVTMSCTPHLPFKTKYKSIETIRLLKEVKGSRCTVMALGAFGAFSC